MSKVQVLKYNPNWKTKFTTESAKLKRILNDNCLAVHHIGSTAIEGLSAKPIIDILVVVKDIFRIGAIENYKFCGELGIPFRRYFSSDDIHIHIFEENNPEIEQNLLFREFLRNNPEEKVEYEKLKLELAHMYPENRTQYSLGKNSLISDIIKRTGFRGLCLRYVFHDLEKLYHKKHLGDEGPYKFVLYEGSKIISAATVNNDWTVKFSCESHYEYIKQLIERWCLPENDLFRSQR